LRPGGYGRLGKYLENLEEAMVACGARDRDELICKRFGKEDEAARLVDGELDEEGVRVDASERRVRIVRMAGVLNSHEVAARVTGDPRYAAGKNGKPPRKVGSTLVLLDCLSCDKCVPVCPNDANFAIDTAPEELAYEDVVVDEAGAVARVAGGLWTVKRAEQWANYADACNECGNCDVFCPEDGGPYVMKARYFGSRASFDASPALDGLFIDRTDAGLRVDARVGGRACLMMVSGDEAVVDDGVVRVRYDRRRDQIVGVNLIDGARGPHRLSGSVYLGLRTLVRAVVEGGRVNPVSVRLQA
jgi:putative selenate reductase